MNRLFVANIPYRISENDLENLFLSHGYAVAGTRIVMDRETGNSRGFGFVDLANANEMDEAIDVINGMVLEGRTLVVRVAEDRREQKPKGATDSHVVRSKKRTPNAERDWG